jgi:hypothetical protein
VEVLVWDGQPEAEYARGWVRNGCAEGLGLSTAEPIQEGTLLQLRVTSLPDSVPWVEVTVRNCHQLGDRWIVGCAFTRPPPEDTLLSFR